MSKTKFLPESMYSVDKNMNYEKLTSFYNSGRSVTGAVIRINLTDEYLEVSLGGNLTGILPLQLSSIYPIVKKDGSISANIFTLVGNTIRIKIISITPQIVLSRIDSMVEALEYLKKEEKIEYACVTGMTKKSIFFDVSAGIIGRSYSKDLSPLFYMDAHDIGIKNGDIIPAKIIRFIEAYNKFDLSVVDALPPVNDTFQQGDIITATVFFNIPNCKDSYFVLIDGLYVATVSAPKTSLKYGDKISAFICNINDGRIKLSLVNKF